jgi:hypothetical protein
MSTNYLSNLSPDSAEYEQEVASDGFRYFYVIQKLKVSRWGLFDRGIIRSWDPTDSIENIFGKYRNDETYRFCLYSSCFSDFADNLVENERKAYRSLLERVEKGIEHAKQYGFQFSRQGDYVVSETTGLQFKSCVAEHSGVPYFYLDECCGTIGLHLYGDKIDVDDEERIMHHLIEYKYLIYDKIDSLRNIAATSIFHSSTGSSEIFLLEYSHGYSSIYHYKLEEIQGEYFKFWNKLEELTRNHKNNTMNVANKHDKFDEYTKSPKFLNYYVLYCESKGKRYFGVPLTYYDAVILAKNNAHCFNPEFEKMFIDPESMYDNRVIRPVQSDYFGDGVNDFFTLNEQGLMPFSYTELTLPARNRFYAEYDTMMDDLKLSDKRNKYIHSLNFPLK